MSTTTTTPPAPPVADWLDPSGMARDPYPTYERLRALGSVVHAPAIGRYLLTSHASVSAAERRPELFSAYSETNLTMVRALGGRPMLRKNDPDHCAERSSINATLRPRTVRDTWSPGFSHTVDRWIDHLLEMGPADADLERDFAAPVASSNLIDLLGLSGCVGVGDMRRWSTDFIDGIGNILDAPEVWRRCEQSQAEVGAVLDEILPRLRRAPDSSITSHLLHCGLPDEIVRANVHLAISGGVNEPAHMITNMVWALGTHPGQLAVVRSGEVEWGAAFEETARWLSPIGMVPRETTQELDWFGTRIPLGANVGLLLGSANRDESVFDDAGRYEVRRTARGHLGFGSGVHMCAGRWAAKSAVGEIALPRLYERIPTLRVDPARAADWNGWVFRGLVSLPVTW
ncbi:cytochrome P450 [Tsukamurella soli]|uniref:Cytochrome P450 n=1 Tax=Tsukamurella soli TaxID=644556 RepID=A0ABP8JRY3_9ACTN